ncbi:MAG: NYN domain-containing protein [Nibricoccus sp.]
MFSGSAPEINDGDANGKNKAHLRFFGSAAHLNALHKDDGLPKLVAVGYEKHLLIDGSNILHAWPELRLLLRRERDVAREKLLQIVRILHDAEQVRLTVVFDGRGSELVVEHPGDATTFSLVFTPTGMTADDAIEQLVGKAADAAVCLVATDDCAERQTIEAVGATGLSAEELRAWVTRTEQHQQTQLASQRRKNETIWKNKI